ncbi:MAG: hypothetical protein Q8P45_00745 [Candidatus Harrisonbacteria bacterium]|nr:hypothetical protein [Candidatus Harrisonbacteria bacterium]
MQNKTLEWVLRIGIFGEFLGHGVFALQQKAGWLKYFDAVGISEATANALMPYIGAMDIVLAILALILPFRLALLWMAVWGLWTAMIRWPIGPDPVWDFFERWANWAAPMALLLYYGWPKTARQWLSARK